MERLKLLELSHKAISSRRDKLCTLKIQVSEGALSYIYIRSHSYALTSSSIFHSSQYSNDKEQDCQCHKFRKYYALCSNLLDHTTLGGKSTSTIIISPYSLIKKIKLSHAFIKGLCKEFIIYSLESLKLFKGSQP